MERREEEESGIVAGALRASGLTIHHYEEAEDGRNCRLLWSLKASKLDLSRNQKSGIATELEGELFKFGEKVYAFYAHEAIVAEVFQPTSSIHIEGHIEVRELLSGATISCGDLVWEPGKGNLNLGGRVRLTSQPDFVLTAPKAVIHDIGTFENGRKEEGGLGSQNGLFNYIQRLGHFGSSIFFYGPCYFQMKVPDIVGNAKLNHLMVLSLRKKNFINIFDRIKHLVRNVNFIQKAAADVHVPHVAQSQEVIVEAKNGLHMDMEEGHISLRGPVCVSCPSQDAKVNAGSINILLREGAGILHRGVSAKLQSLHLEASKVTWFICSKGDKAEFLNHEKCQSKSYSQEFDQSKGYVEPNYHPEIRQPIRGYMKSQGSGQSYTTDKLAAVENFKASTNGIGMLSSKWNYKNSSRILSSRRKQIISCNSDNAKVILAEVKGFTNLSFILQMMSRSVLSACKVSISSKNGFKTGGSLVSVEMNLSELLAEKVQNKRMIKFAQHEYRDRIEFHDSACAVQLALEEKKKYCKSFDGNLVIAEGDVHIRRR